MVDAGVFTTLGPWERRVTFKDPCRERHSGTGDVASCDVLSSERFRVMALFDVRIARPQNELPQKDPLSALKV